MKGGGGRGWEEWGVGDARKAQWRGRKKGSGRGKERKAKGV